MVKISKDAVKVVKSSNNKGSKMVVTSSKNVVRIFFAFILPLLQPKKLTAFMENFGKIWNFPPIFLVPVTTFYYFLLPNWKILAVKSLAVKL